MSHTAFNAVHGSISLSHIAQEVVMKTFMPIAFTAVALLLCTGSEALAQAVQGKSSSAAGSAGISLEEAKWRMCSRKDMVPSAEGKGCTPCPEGTVLDTAARKCAKSPAGATGKPSAG
jgi:hypothetical protein